MRAFARGFASSLAPGFAPGGVRGFVRGGAARGRVLAFAVVPPLVLSVGLVRGLAAQGYTRPMAAMPEVPSLAYLGVTPARIARPTTARDLALSLAEGVDSAGRVRQGFAVSFQPWFTFRAPLSREKYQRSRLWYIFANLQAGLGLARSAGGDTAATDAVLGVKTTVVDRADENANPSVDRRLQAIEAECVGPARGEGGDAQRFLACVRPRARAVLDSVASERWNAFALSASAVLGGRLARSELGALRYAGSAAWVTAAFPLARRGQLLAQGRVDDVETAAGHAAAASVGARALYGSARANGFVELVGRRSGVAGGGAGDTGAGSATDRARSVALWSAGVEVRAAEKLWLSTGLGSAFRARGVRDQVIVVLNVRWNISDGPRIAPCAGCGLE